MLKVRVGLQGKTQYLVVGVEPYVVREQGWWRQSREARNEVKKIRARYVSIRNKTIRFSQEPGYAMAVLIEDHLANGSIEGGEQFYGTIFVPCSNGVYSADCDHGIVNIDRFQPDRRRAETDAVRIMERARVVETKERGDFLRDADTIEIDLGSINKYRYRRPSRGFMRAGWLHMHQLRPVYALACTCAGWFGWGMYAEMQDAAAREQRERMAIEHRLRIERHRAHASPAQWAAFADAVTNRGILSAYGLSEVHWKVSQSDRIVWMGKQWQGRDVQRLSEYALERNAKLTLLSSSSWTLSEAFDWGSQEPEDSVRANIDEWVPKRYWGLWSRGIEMRHKAHEVNLGVDEHVFALTVPSGGNEEYEHIMNVLKSAASRCEEIRQKFEEGVPTNVDIVIRLFGETLHSEAQA